MTRFKADNLLSMTYPDVAKEWHPTLNGDVTPDDITYGVNKKFWWQCSKCDHEWETTVVHRTTKGAGCPHCNNMKLAQISKTNNLAKEFPNIAKEWHPTKNEHLKPENVSPNSTRKGVWWLSPCGHEWEATVYDRTKRKKKCTQCRTVKRVTGI